MKIKIVNLGINTIGQLADMPLSELKSRFGAYGEMLHQHANGIDESEITPPTAAKSISRSTTFAADTRNNKFLKATLSYLSERVGSELRQQGKQTRCITLKVRYADFATTTRQQTLGQSTDTDQAIFNTGSRMLDRELLTVKQPVRLIGIGVGNLVEAGRQTYMLDAPAPRLEKLNATIDRIRKVRLYRHTDRQDAAAQGHLPRR